MGVSGVLTLGVKAYISASNPVYLSHMSKKGRRYENEILSDIYRETDGEMIGIQAGYSGNHVAPSPDFILNDGRNVHAFEVKKTGKDRQTFSCHEDIDKDDIQQLVRFCRTYNPPTYPYLAVRFNRRQIIVIKLFMGPDNDWERIVESGDIFCPVESSVTRTNNLIVYKPDAGEWPSASDGSDTEHILDSIGWYTDTGVSNVDMPSNMDY